MWAVRKTLSPVTRIGLSTGLKAGIVDLRFNSDKLKVNLTDEVMES